MSDGSENCKYRISGFVDSKGDLQDFEFSTENDEKAIRIASDEYDHVSGKEIWRWIDEQTCMVSDQPPGSMRRRYCIRGFIVTYSKDKLRDFFFLAENDEEALKILSKKYSRIKNKGLWRQVGYEYKNTPVV